jgi:O-methyltransferase
MSKVLQTNEFRDGAPVQNWRWLRRLIPRGFQPQLRGFRKSLQWRKRRRLEEPLRTVFPYTQTNRERQRHLLKLCETIEREQIPGAIVECGVLDGGTAALMAYGTRSSGRKVHLFDAWQGLPPTTERDGVGARSWTGEVVGSPNRVRKIMRKMGIEPSRIRFHVGWFHETFPHAEIEQVALLHVDADFYEPTKLILNRWYPHLAPGGFVQIDDYDSFEGCYKAVDEFLEEHPELELLKGGHFTACWYFRRIAAAPPMLAADQIGA